MPLINDEARKALVTALSGMNEHVNLLYFTQDIECGICRETHAFLDEFCSLSDKLRVSSIDFVAEKDKAEYYGVARIPAILLLDKDDRDTGVRFYGPPAGYEIKSFLSAILELSNGVKLPSAMLKRVQAVKATVHIQVFVSLTCPYCPDAVVNAHRLAMANSNIHADMVDVGVFPHVAIDYDVSGVPKTVINGTHELIGAHSAEELVMLVEKAAGS